jgi:membrane-bound lytic murein transglycosylase B
MISPEGMRGKGIGVRRSVMVPYRPRSAAAGRIEGTYRAIDTCGMAKKPEPPTPTTWTIYKIAAKAVRLGTVEAADEATAIDKAAAAFKVPANKLMAIRR